MARPCLILDQNVSYKVKYLLRDLPLEIVHVGTLGMEEWQDEKPYLCFQNEGWYIASFDKDFLLHSAKHGAPPRVIFLRNVNNHLSVDIIKRMAGLIRKAYQELEESGEAIVEAYMI